METIATSAAPATVPCREVTDRNGRAYRIGETGRDLLGRPRWVMVLCPWIAMAGVSASAYAFAAAAPEGLRTSRLWSGGGADFFWLTGVWVFCQAAVAFPAGQLRESGRLPARDALLFGAAAALTGHVFLAYVPDPLLACLGFGTFGGIGTGLVYATCVSTAGKWYPERKGGRTGLVGGGFAYGSVPFLSLLADYRDVGGGQREALVVVGAVCCVAVASAGRLVKDPPANWWPPHADPRKRPGPPGTVRDPEKNPPAVRQFTAREAARRPVLWMMWGCLLCTAGVHAFGAAMLVPLGTDMGFTGGALATAASLNAVVNGTGCGVIGWMSDRCGRRKTLAVVCVLLGGAQFGTPASANTGNTPLFLACSTVAGLCGGAAFPLFAAMTADFFGENHSAANYGIVHSAQLISGPLGSGLGAAVAVSAWSDEGAFALAGGVGLLSALLAVLLRRPGRLPVRKIQPNPYPISREAM
ncbi:MFS transporter [Streptomyces axinellae]|uniref:OFA family MFS transporter n=1 Tax=Streptomyces axinellae TaxID=552788 RepID=A0ABP6C191_9ACTN